VSAQTTPGEVWKDITKFFEPLIRLLLDAESGDGALLFQRFLFAMIIIAVIYAVLDRIDFFSNNGFALWTITIAISILSVRFIANKDLVETLLLPSGVLGVSLISVIPFMIYFYFVEEGFKDQKLLRRFAWIVYLVVFLGLYFTRLDLIKYSWMYLVSAGLAVLSLVFDGTIRRIRLNMQLDKLGYKTRRPAIDNLKKKLVELPQLVTDNIISQSEANSREKEYKRELAFLHK